MTKINFSINESSVTDNPNFQKGFGDSKMVDESGNPKVYLHATQSPGFSEFDTSKSTANGLMFFTDNNEFADSGATPGYGLGNLDTGGIYPVYLKVSNPFDYEDRDKVILLAKNILNNAEKNEDGNYWLRETISNYNPRGNYVDYNKASRQEKAQRLFIELKSGYYGTYESEMVVNLIKQLGFDGIYITESLPGQKVIRNIAIFSSYQVKSVWNNGNGDPTKKKINESTDSVDFKSGRKAYYDSKKAYPFAYKNGHLYIGSAGKTHYVSICVPYCMQMSDLSNIGRIGLDEKIISLYDQPNMLGEKDDLIPDSKERYHSFDFDKYHQNIINILQDLQNYFGDNNRVALGNLNNWRYELGRERMEKPQYISFSKLISVGDNPNPKQSVIKETPQANDASVLSNPHLMTRKLFTHIIDALTGYENILSDVYPEIKSGSLVIDFVKNRMHLEDGERVVQRAISTAVALYTDMMKSTVKVNNNKTIWSSEWWTINISTSQLVNQNGISVRIKW